MAKILFSLAGEGLGHSTRSFEIIKRLAKRKHELVVLTGGDSYDPINRSIQVLRNVRLVRMPMLRLSYTPDGKVSIAKMISKNIKTLAGARDIIDSIEQLIDKEHFDFAIVDFEPFVPRAAKNKGLPFITYDNQHRFVYEKLDLKEVSKKHLMSYILTKQTIKRYHPMGEKCVITSVFSPKLDYKTFAGKLEVFVIGPIIREDIQNLKKSVKRDDFVLIYVKRQLESAIIPKIQSMHENFVMYVKEPKEHPRSRQIKFKKQTLEGFAKDMARCKAVISSAGEQLMGEALYLGKPLFLLPEEGTYEQKLNAELVKRHMVGDSKDISKVTAGDITQFLSRLPLFEENIRKQKVRNGIDDMMKIIDDELKKVCE
jgi:uncharacterized protein (TIGR00661 family)